MELKDILTELIGAEQEAERVISRARKEAERILSESRENFNSERESRLADAREQARSVTESARSSGETEANQILQKASVERERINKRYEEKVDGLIEALVREIAEQYSRQGEK
jgi:F-type H+-transporting ATPase subunit b